MPAQLRKGQRGGRALSGRGLLPEGEGRALMKEGVQSLRGQQSRAVLADVWAAKSRGRGAAARGARGDQVGAV